MLFSISMSFFDSAVFVNLPCLSSSVKQTVSSRYSALFYCVLTHLIRFSLGFICLVMYSIYVSEDPCYFA